MLNLNTRQVLKALEEPATPKKSTGRPPTLGIKQCQQLVDFVCASKKNRRMTYKELADEFFNWDIGAKGIKAALDREGFSSRWAMRKPPISETNRKKRLQFAQEHRG
jgi:hypothetical protein